MIKQLTITTLIALSLTACNVDGARVHGDGYSVEVEGDGHYHDHHRGGKFCPPGHAKKGWC